MRGVHHSASAETNSPGLTALPLFDQPARQDPFAYHLIDPTDEERRLMELLEKHRGPENAIPVPQVCRALEHGGVVPTERNVKQLVAGLRTRHRVKIGASRRAGRAGLFLCTEPAHIADAIRAFSAQMLSMIRVVRTFITPKERAELAGQLKLALIDDDQTDGRPEA